MIKVSYLKRFAQSFALITSAKSGSNFKAFSIQIYLDALSAYLSRPTYWSLFFFLLRVLPSCLGVSFSGFFGNARNDAFEQLQKQ